MVPINRTASFESVKYETTESKRNLIDINSENHLLPKKAVKIGGNGKVQNLSL